MVCACNDASITEILLLEYYLITRDFREIALIEFRIVKIGFKILIPF